MRHNSCPPNDPFVAAMRRMTIYGFLFFLPATLTTAADADEVQLSISTNTFSDYILKHGIVAHDEPVVQSSINVSLPHGFYAELWGSSGLNREKNFGKEVDYTFGWTGKHIGVGLSYFDLNELFRGSKENVVSPFLDVSFKVKVGEHQTLSPFFHFDHLHVTRASSSEFGNFALAGVRHEWRPTERLTIREKSWLCWNRGPFGHNPGFALRYEVGLGVTVNRSTTISPFLLRVSIPTGSIEDRDTKFVVGAGITISP